MVDYPIKILTSPDELLEEANKLKIEGWVIRRNMYQNWFKIKTTNTADVFVIGFKEGKNKYEGEVGALYVAVFKDKQQVEVAAVSGMTDEVRFAIDEDKDIGRVCEITYDRLDKNRLRHPRFLRWREDKKRKDCTWEQLE